jgi:hypothetical protein
MTIRLFPFYLFILFYFSSLLPSFAAEPLDRSWGDLELGMSVEALQKKVQVEEITGGYLGLLEGERYFKVQPSSLPPNVLSLDCQTFKDKLYKINVLYHPEYITRTTWEAILHRYTGRYGKVPAQLSPLGERKMLEILRWEDIETIFILKREKNAKIPGSRRPPDPPVVIETYLDQSLWQERFQKEIDQIPFF